MKKIEFGLRANNASRRDGLWAPPANKQTQSNSMKEERKERERRLIGGSQLMEWNEIN